MRQGNLLELLEWTSLEKHVLKSVPWHLRFLYEYLCTRVPSYKTMKQRAQTLAEANEINQTTEKYPEHDVSFIWFTDEKMFLAEQLSVH